MGVEHSRQSVHCQCDRKKTKHKKKVFSLLTLSSNEKESVHVGLALGLSLEISKKPRRQTCYGYEELSQARRQRNLRQLEGSLRVGAECWGGEGI